MHGSHWHCAGSGGGRQGPFGGRGGFLNRFGGGGFMGGGMRAARMLASGDLQLIILEFLKAKPHHGYEVIKALEEHSSGLYTPSPGMIYPALTFIEEMNYATSETSGNKKLYKITEAGSQYLEQNRALVDQTLSQLALFGKKMAQARKHFGDESAEEDPVDWHQARHEFRALKDELKSAIIEAFRASPQEKQRIVGILRKAIADIRGK